MSLTPEEVAASIRDKDPGTRPLPEAELPEAEIKRMGEVLNRHRSDHTPADDDDHSGPTLGRRVDG